MSAVYQMCRHLTNSDIIIQINELKFSETKIKKFKGIYIYLYIL